ncbi:hypothetical protein GCM10028791_21720 [Echinicola sediminis]
MPDKIDNSSPATIDLSSVHQWMEMALLSTGFSTVVLTRFLNGSQEYHTGLGLSQKEWNAHQDVFNQLDPAIGSQQNNLELLTFSFSLGKNKFAQALIKNVPANDGKMWGRLYFLSESSIQLDDKSEKQINVIISGIKKEVNRELALSNISFSEKQFRRFFEKSMGLMCSHDMEGTFLMINDASAQSLGYQREEIIGKTLYDIIPEKHHQSIAIYLEEIQTNGISSGIMQTMHKDGSPRFWLYTNVRQQKENEPPYVLGNALDITERHQLEREYNRIKEMLLQTNSVARIGGWEVDFISDNIYWSEITREIHEVAPEFVPDLNKALGFYPEKSLENLNKVIHEAVNNAIPYDIELQLITHKGNKKWVRSIGKPEFHNGICTRLYGTFQDITEKKRTELEIARSKKLLEDVLNASSEVSIISTDVNGTIRVFNKGAEKMLGYDAEEMIGKQSPVIIHDRLEVENYGKELTEQYGINIEGFRAFVHKSEVEGSDEREWTYIRKDGSSLDVSLTITSMRDEKGEITGYLGIATEITKRKIAEQQLIVEKARLNAFVTYAPAAVAMFDREIRYIAYSNRWLEEYKLQGQDLTNRTHYEVFGNISEEWKEIHQRVLQGEVIRSEEDIWRPEGWDHDQYLRWEVRPWYQFDNSIGGILMLTQDITESCLQREELKKAKIMAEQASIAKSEFLANMSHEIRTPLNGVIGFTDLVLKTNLSETQLQYLSIVNQSANTLLNIINDILDFSKIEAGKLELDIDKCDLYELSDQASDIITYEVHKKGLEMLLNISPSIPRYAWADSVRLKQILVNLLSNASKFTETGEIELEISALSAIDENQEMHIRFSVRDTGIGIKPEKQQKIFEAFSQEDVSTTKKYGGTGLGLTISNSLLNLMGSHLQLESEPGKGSNFFFDLKLKCEDGDPLAWQYDLDLQKILIVDDNDNNRIILERMFELKGIQTAQAKNGFEALQQLIDGEQYDVILMDYHMPIMDGIETARKIREGFEQQPIIFLHSSSDDDKIRKACRDLNIQHRLVKPIKIQEMYEALLRVTRNTVQVHQERNQSNGKSTKMLQDGTKILIAEDNSINMLLAKTVINNLSNEVTIFEAVNGKEALELCHQEVPDIIFMDIQMPVMNGLETTMQIREKYAQEDILIIALTAGNIKGEKEKCINAGMNDFIAKPFVEEDLLQLLKKWGNHEKVELSQLKEDNGNNIEGFDIEELQNFLGFTDINDPMFQNILQSGIEELEKSAREINNLVQTGNTSLSPAAHKLYGSAATLKTAKLSKLSSRLEKRESYNFQDQDLMSLIGEILDEIKTVSLSIKQYILG